MTVRAWKAVTLSCAVYTDDVFFSGMCVDLCIQFTLMFWLPSTEEEYVLYILSAMWGLTDGIWQTQINGKYNDSKIVTRTSETTITATL